MFHLKIQVLNSLTNFVFFFKGPNGVPLLGYAPYINEHHPTYPFIALEKLAEIHGPVVGFYLGPKAFISVCGYEAVREAFLNEDLNGRPSNAVVQFRTFHQRLGNQIILF